MAKRVQTQISGISTSSTYEDGATCSLVNLRPKNGAMHPVSPRKIVQELTQEYDIIFLHRNNNYENWIGIINRPAGDFTTIFSNIKSPNPTLITDELREPVNSVQQIGNTLSLVTDSDVYYLLYQNNQYTYLGQLPDVPPIALATSNKMATMRKYYNSEYPSLIANRTDFIDATKGLVNKAMEELMNGWTDSDGYHEGFGFLFFDACFLRYAFRLYDGTLTKHSPPILIMPTRSTVNRSTEMAGESTKVVAYRIWPNGELYNSSHVLVRGHQIYMDYDFLTAELQKWTDLIESVDIFVSPPIGISNIENIRQDMVIKYDERAHYYDLIKELTADNIYSVEHTSNFYYVKSIPFFTMNQQEPLSTPNSIEDGRLKNLIFQEVMPDDQFSHHRYGGTNSYSYNNRLHIAAVQTTLYRGYNPNYFLWHNYDPDPDAVEDAPYSGYNGVSYPSVPGVNYSNLVMEVEINTGNNIEKTYRTLFDYSMGADRKLFMSAFLSYPDPRAKRITIYRLNYVNGSPLCYRIYTAELKAHSLLNLAYHVNTELLPIVETNPVQVPNPYNTKSISITEPNKIKVSELNNPLLFPSATTYQVGNGEILAMATNAMLVSDRNYGQYPLYVFTTTGIFTLNIGQGDALYSNIAAPTYMEPPTSNIVGETPYGVAFVTYRGIMLINGQSVEFLSPQLEETPTSLNIEKNSNCDGVLIPVDNTRFTELLKSLKSLVFNPYENELIVNTGTDQIYVLALNSRQFYQSTEKFGSTVGNAYPNLYVVNRRQLKDYSTAENGLTHVSVITRPLQFSTPNIKRIERMILRALFYQVTAPDTDKFSLTMSQYSNDGINFVAAKGYPLKEGNHKDIDMGLFARGKFRHFLFALAGVVDEQSKIFYLDSIFDDEYKNTKLR